MEQSKVIKYYINVETGEILSKEKATDQFVEEYDMGQDYTFCDKYMSLEDFDI